MLNMPTQTFIKVCFICDLLETLGIFISLLLIATMATSSLVSGKVK